MYKEEKLLGQKTIKGNNETRYPYNKTNSSCMD